jgi:hypothetical protein
LNTTQTRHLKHKVMVSLCSIKFGADVYCSAVICHYERNRFKEDEDFGSYGGRRKKKKEATQTQSKGQCTYT